MDISKISQLFKISGGHWLSDSFNYDIFDNDKCVVKANRNNEICTELYKLPKIYTLKYLQHLCDSRIDFQNGIDREIIFANFINTIPHVTKTVLDTIGIECES